MDAVTATQLQTIADHLRQQTSASRATVRVVDAEGQPRLLAESLALGVPSMHDGPQPAVTAAPTYIALEQTREILVQGDCRIEGPRPPASLIEHYRVFAQMLAPVFDDATMVATISVHQQDAVRHWTADDIAALRAAQAAVTAVLGSAAANEHVPTAEPHRRSTR
jgi:GAF domain-containing protein